MKKLLIIITIAIMSLTSIQASPGYALKHTNPMPNLVRYTLGNAELLQLSKMQVKEIRAWTKANKPQIMKLVKLVMREERMLLEEALTTDTDIVAASQKMLDARKDIIRIKSACRANLKKVLSQKQYAQVVGIYRSTLPKMKKMKK